MSSDHLAPIAALVYTPDDHVEPILLQAAQALASRGVRLGGVLQRNLPRDPDDPCAMELEDLHSGARFALSQSLGRGSEACRLDPGSLAQAAMAVRHALDQGVDLVMVNKFGAQEVAGAGLRDEMALAVTAGIPLLTAVGSRFLDEWAQFTGNQAVLLKPDLPAILDWWDDLKADAR